MEGLLSTGPTPSSLSTALRHIMYHVTARVGVLQLYLAAQEVLPSHAGSEGERGLRTRNIGKMRRIRGVRFCDLSAQEQIMMSR